MPEGAEAPELVVLDEVPVPTLELAADPALPPAPPPAPAPPPPPCAKAVEDKAMHANATMADFLIMDVLPEFEQQSRQTQEVPFAAAIALSASDRARPLRSRLRAQAKPMLTPDSA